MRKILFIITSLAIAVSAFADISDSVSTYDSTQFLTDSTMSVATDNNNAISSETTQEESGVSKEDVTVLFLFIAFWVALLILARSTIRSDHYTLSGRSGNGSRNASWTGEYIGRFDGSGASGRW